MTSYIREQGAALARAGYSVVSVYSTEAEKLFRPGLAREDLKKLYKAPTYAWGNKPLTVEQCEGATPGFGCGIMCGFGEHPVVGVDCDIAGDPELSAAVRKRLDEILDFEGYAFVRHGKRPKFMIVGAMDPNKVHGKLLSKRYTRDTRAVPDNEKDFVQLEIIGKGFQFVAYAIHPDTQSPYEWEPTAYADNPYDVHPEDLPVFTLEKLEQCISAFEEEVEKAGGYFMTSAGKRAKTNLGEDDWTNVEPMLPALGMTAKGAYKLLDDVIKSGKVDVSEYSWWLDMGMALHHEFNGSEEGFEVWNKLSEGDSKYKGVENLKYKWSTFGKRTDRELKTMRTYRALWRSLPENDRFAFNESGLANRVADEFGGKVCYVHELGRFYSCDPRTNRWQESSDEVVRLVIRNMIEFGLVEEAELLKQNGMPDRAVELSKFRSKCRSMLNKMVTNVLKDTQSLAVEHFDSFDAKRDVFAVENGVIDLNTYEFHETTPEMRITRGSSTKYEPGAKSALWEQAINDIFLGDSETIRYFQKVVGYAMLGNPVLHFGIFLLGNGRNGKSLMIRVLKEVFDSYGFTVNSNYFTDNSKAGSSNDDKDPTLLKLAGRRFVISSEVSPNAKMKEEVIKRIVSTDILSGRALYSNAVFQIVPSWVLFVAVNNLPEITGTDDGIWERMRIIEFKAKFDANNPKTDPLLLEKLLTPENRSGILNWCLEGLELYRKEGVKDPAVVKKAKEEIREEFDVFGNWISTCLTTGEGLSEKAHALFENWQQYEMENRLPNRLTENAFGRELSKRFNKKRVTKGFVYQGVRIRSEDLDDAMSAYL